MNEESKKAGNAENQNPPVSSNCCFSKPTRWAVSLTRSTLRERNLSTIPIQTAFFAKESLERF